MVKTSLDAEPNNVQYICWHFLEGWFKVVVRFRKPETHTNAQHRHNTLQTMAIEVREGQAAAALQMI